MNKTLVIVEDQLTFIYSVLGTYFYVTPIYLQCKQGISHYMALKNLAWVNLLEVHLYTIAIR